MYLRSPLQSPTKTTAWHPILPYTPDAVHLQQLEAFNRLDELIEPERTSEVSAMHELSEGRAEGEAAHERSDGLPRGCYEEASTAAEVFDENQ